MNDQDPNAEVCESPTTRPDKDIESDVRLVLLEDFLLGRSEIAVGIKNGLIVLHGSVPTADLRDRIIDAIRRIPGVVGIESQITVLG